MSIEKEALRYDLPSLINLQKKHLENITIFEKSIKNEREAIQQEENAEVALETKLRQNNLGIAKIDDTEIQLILLDLPKLKSTRIKRDQTIMLLKAAIIEEQGAMDREEQMIHFLEIRRDSQK